MLSYLLIQAHAPIDVAFGGTEFASDDDWGYGPPRYLAPEEVTAAATYLNQTPFERLAVHYEPNDMTAKRIYPGDWEPDGAYWPQPWYEQLTAFFQAASQAGDALVLWLD